MLLEECLEQESIKLILASRNIPRIKHLIKPLARLDVSCIKKKLITKVLLDQKSFTGEDSSLLRKLFLALKKEGLIKSYPLEVIPDMAKKLEKGLLKTEDVLDMHRNLKNRSKYYNKEPSRSGALALLLSAGLGQRMTDLVCIKVKEVKHDSIIIKNRSIPLNLIATPLWQLLRNELAEEAKIDRNPNDYLLLPDYKQELNNRRMICFSPIKLASRFLHIRKNISMDVIRYFYLSQMRGIEISTLEKVFGEKTYSYLDNYDQAVEFLKSRQ